MAITVHEFETAQTLDGGATAYFTRSASAAKFGSYGLLMQGGNAYRTCWYTGSTVNRDGMAVGAWIRADSGGHAFKAPGIVVCAQGSGNLGYQSMLDMRGPLLTLRKDMDYATRTDSSSNGAISEGTWYWLEVVGTSSGWTATLYDAPGGSSLLSATKSSTAYSSGYVGATVYSNGSLDGLDLDLSGAVALTANDLTAAPVLESVALTQLHVVSADDLATTPTLESVALAQTHVLSADDLSVTASLESVALGQIHALSVSDLATTPTLESVALTQNAVTPPVRVKKVAPSGAQGNVRHQPGRKSRVGGRIGDYGLLPSKDKVESLSTNLESPSPKPPIIQKPKRESGINVEAALIDTEQTTKEIKQLTETLRNSINEKEEANDLNDFMYIVAIAA